MILEDTNKTDVEFCKSDYEAINKVHNMLQDIADKMEINDYMFWDFENLSINSDMVQNILNVLDAMHGDSVLQ